MHAPYVLVIVLIVWLWKPKTNKLATHMISTSRSFYHGFLQTKVYQFFSLTENPLAQGWSFQPGLSRACWSTACMLCLYLCLKFLEYFINIINPITSDKFKSSKRADTRRGILVGYTLAESVLWAYEPMDFLSAFWS